MSKDAKTIQFDREDLLRLASDLHHECYKVMEAVRLEDLRLTCLDYDERIEQLQDEHEKYIKKLTDSWRSRIKAGEEELKHGLYLQKESLKIQEESLKIQETCKKTSAENNKLKKTDWVRQCDLLTIHLTEAECKASTLSKKNAELVKGQKTLQEKLKLSPEALAKKSKLIHENKALYARVRELENALGLDPTEEKKIYGVNSGGLDTEPCLDPTKKES